MPRRAIAALGAVVLAGLLALVVAAATKQGTAGIDIGIPADFNVVDFKHGGEACQGPIPLDEDVSLVEFTPAPGGVQGPEMRLSLRDFDTGEELSAADIPPAILTGGPRPTRIPPAGAGRAVSVCIAHEGGPPIQLWGDQERGDIRESGVFKAHPTNQSMATYLDGREVNNDLFVRFPAPARSLLAETPTMLDRLATFRMPWFGPWAAWLLLAGVLVATPLLLVAALRASLRDDPGDG